MGSRENWHEMGSLSACGSLPFLGWLGSSWIEVEGKV